MISEPMVRSAQTVHRSCVKISTISKRIKTSFHLSFVTYVYHRVRPKRYLSMWYVWRKPCTYLAQTLTPSPNRPIEIRHDPSHLGVPLGASKTISEPMVRLAHTVHLSYINTNTISKWTERDPHDPRHLGVPSGASKTISEPMVRLAQTVHRSCVKISTISKRTKTSFHLSFLT